MKVMLFGDGTQSKWKVVTEKSCSYWNDPSIITGGTLNSGEILGRRSSLNIWPNEETWQNISTLGGIRQLEPWLNHRCKISPFHCYSSELSNYGVDEWEIDIFSIPFSYKGKDYSSLVWNTASVSTQRVSNSLHPFSRLRCNYSRDRGSLCPPGVGRMRCICRTHGYTSNQWSILSHLIILWGLWKTMTAES